MDKEITQDIKDSKEQRSSSVSIVDNKFVANFSVSSNDNGDYSYENYQKIFDTIKDYSTYLDKFLKL